MGNNGSNSASPTTKNKSRTLLEKEKAETAAVPAVLGLPSKSVLGFVFWGFPPPAPYNWKILEMLKKGKVGFA